MRHCDKRHIKSQISLLYYRYYLKRDLTLKETARCSQLKPGTDETFVPLPFAKLFQAGKCHGIELMKIKLKYFITYSHQWLNVDLTTNVTIFRVKSEQ